MIKRGQAKRKAPATRKPARGRADLKRANADLQRELARARQQQAATADVLKVISRAPFDLQTVLDTLVQSAVILCCAERSAIRFLRDGLYHNVASYGFSPRHKERMEREPLAPERGSITGRVALDRKSVHIIDVQLDPDPELANRSRSGNTRTILGVPLLREEIPIGVLILQRSVAQAFTDDETRLAETFASQAVIAIENARLFDRVQTRTEELTESLEQQTATSEVLQVISSSPGDLQPVFEAMLANATRLCDAKFGTLFQVRDGFSHAAAVLGDVPPQLRTFLQRKPLDPSPASALGRVIATKQIVHIADITEDAAYVARDPYVLAITELTGTRSLLAVPMLKDTELIGAIAVYRTEVRPFSEKQIDLLTNFAKQAVIAIENVRLLNELRQRTGELTESLEQQTATSEVLQVISSSPGELQPVFDALLERATRVCGAKIGTLLLYEGGNRFRPTSTYGVPAAFAQAQRDRPTFEPPSPNFGLGLLVASKQVVHHEDFAKEWERAGKPDPARPLIELGGARTFLGVPMLKEGELVGALGIYRQEVRPFTNKQIELVQNFAKQAVIAIENVRLLNEAIAGAADCDLGSAAGHQQFAW
jgi:two-component system NtrC family sensor kinase